MNLTVQSKTLINQITDFLDVIDNQSFTKPLAVFSNSSIGQHFRHIHGFYDCFFKGIETGIINYDNRERQVDIESDWCCCQECFSEFNLKIDKIDINQPIKIAQGKGEEEISSSVGRELMYAIDHAIHHLAIIKIGMRTSFPEIQIDQDLGVAPSTLEYRKSVCAQ